MTEGTIAKWYKAEGDAVAAGDILCEIETDKATMEVESVDDGVLGKILVPDGSAGVAVNSVIALLLEDGEDKSVLDSYEVKESGIGDQESEEKEEEKKEGDSHVAEAPRDDEVKEEKPNSLPVTNRQPTINNRIKASPLAKRLAAEYGVDIAQIIGTGPKGRIVRADVESFKKSGGGAAIATGSAPAFSGRNPEETTAIPNSGMRKVIAKRLLESKQTVPHFYLTVDCQMDAVLNARKELNAIGEVDGSYKLTVNDFIVKASAMALRKVPEANASWGDEAILQYNNVDVSVAVAIDGGLITPIVKNADHKTLSEISAVVKDLVVRAKEGKLAPEEYQGGGFSLSNLGMYGIKEFSAIINPPQGCILAVGASVPQFVPDENGEPKLANVMSVTLSCDHRVIDGAVGATFLKHFKQYIEQPMAMFV
jgi:pyruvate dehydrogenase E2 component (dihydrolipoamide acetyltransferase)